jgi:signal transduction histidine kinase
MALPRPQIPPAAAELIGRISWLIRLRWLAIVGVAVAIVVAFAVLGAELAWRQLAAVTAALAAYNLLLTLVVARLRREHARGELAEQQAFDRLGPRVALAPNLALSAWLAIKDATVFAVTRLRHPNRRAELRRRKSTLADLLVPRELWSLDREWEVFQAAAFAFAQISVDLVALAALLHFSGGVESPLLYYFIFHVIISSILLSRQATIMQTSFAFALIVALGLGECFGLLHHFPFPFLARSDAYHNLGFVAAQLLVMGSTLYLAAYMASNIASHQRSYERETAHLTADITDKADRLASAYRELRQVERAKSQYMRKVAHELRGPLGTIQTALKVVLQGIAGELPEGPREMIGRAERRAGELAQVTQDLLALSRAREGPVQPSAVPVMLGDLVREVAAETKELAGRAGVSMVVEMASDLGAVRGDAQGLLQLVGNLVTNAIRYTPSGGLVTLRTVRMAGITRLEVVDTGIGISAEDLPHIFEEFYRAPNARTHTQDGTGLGLAIVRAVAKQHGGSVRVTSEPGRGTCFTVDLPCTGAVSLAVANATAAADKPVLAARGEKN